MRLSRINANSIDHLWGSTQLRLAVAGLNPYAGEGELAEEALEEQYGARLCDRCDREPEAHGHESALALG